jgi:hypothetical protein
MGKSRSPCRTMLDFETSFVRKRVVTMSHLSQKFTLRAKRSPTSDVYPQKYEQLGSTVQSSLTIESSSIAKGGKCRRICFSRRI